MTKGHAWSMLVVTLFIYTAYRAAGEHEMVPYAYVVAVQLLGIVVFALGIIWLKRNGLDRREIK